MLLPLLCLLQTASPDTLRIPAIEHPPRPGETVDSSRYGPPQLRLRTGQGATLVWLLTASDTFFVAVRIADSTPYWGDDFVLSINTIGQGRATPGHDDFQWYFRRTLDSTVIFRGRNGRWEAPRGDPDWRLGTERSGGGWEVNGWDDARGWSLILRLDPAWLKAEGGRLPRVAFRIYDNSPQGWFAWPQPPDVTAVSVEQTPSLWGHLKLAAPPRNN
jgi:hypothetical protein